MEREGRGREEEEECQVEGEGERKNKIFTNETWRRPSLTRSAHTRSLTTSLFA